MNAASHWETALSRGLRVLALAAESVVFAVFIMAGLGKLLDLAAFDGSLRSWALIPVVARPLLVLGLPTAELFLGVAWLVGVRRRVCRAAAAILLAAFMAAIGAHLWFAEPPDCRCFGPLELFDHQHRTATGALRRDAVLFLMLIPSFIMNARSATPDAAAERAGVPA